MRSKNHEKYLVAGGIALICTLAVLGIRSTLHRVFNDWENKTIDYRFEIRGNGVADPRIVLVDIDDDSIDRIGRWPWDRAYHAKMIDLLSKSGAAVIGYDILFSQPGKADEDRTLLDALARAGNVVSPVGIELDRNTPSLYLAKREIGALQGIRETGTMLGHISSNRDLDGTIRRVPLVVDSGEELVPAFSLAILERYFRAPMDKVVIEPGKHIVLKGQNNPSPDRSGDLEIPIDRQGTLLINYVGRWTDTFSHFSFADLLEAGTTDEGRQALSEFLRGKICIVSNTATGYDLKPIPYEKDYPGGGIHANAVNTVLTGLYLRPAQGLVSIGVVFLLSILTSVLSIRTRWWLGLIWSGLIGAVYVFLSVLAFSKGYVLEILAPVSAVALTGSVCLLYQNYLSRRHVIELVREKARIGETLRDVTDALRINEASLTHDREELSRLMDEIRQVRNEENEKFIRIKHLEAALDQANSDREKLLRKKAALEEKVADFLMAPAGEPNSVTGEWEIIRQECAHHGIITQNTQVLEAFKRAKRAAVTKDCVLILGETGTGKELFARAIYKMSSRSNKPFVTVNVPSLQDNLIESELFGHKKGAFTGAISDKMGMFKRADGGTIFLDEIGDMKIELQTKLLRVLETGQVDSVGGSAPVFVDVRIIAATNRDLESEVRLGNFREDLYYRLMVVPVHIPPLRERPEDVEFLADYFLKELNLEQNRKLKGFSVEAMNRIKRHPWAGNVRELKNAVHRGSTNAGAEVISVGDLQLAEARISVNVYGKDDRKEATMEADPISDEDFLDLVRNNRFSISKTAEDIRLARGTVGNRFKGICFGILARCNGDIKQAAEVICAGKSGADTVEQMVGEYYHNLLAMIRGFDNCSDALNECRRRSGKNLPQRYFQSVDYLVQRHFNKTRSEQEK
jgi:transcriptional regulator with GAF, ATPase, and Fis domain/CHASE2 domain-containing sensor protein